MFVRLFHNQPMIDDREPGLLADFMVGLQAGGLHFPLYLASLLMNATVGSSFFMFVGAIASNLRMAQTLGPIVVVLTSLFGYDCKSVLDFPLFLRVCMYTRGFYLNTDSIPVYYTWIRAISFQKYVFENLVSTSCDGEDIHLIIVITGHERVHRPCV